VTDDPALEPLIPRIIAFAAERRLPALHSFSTAVERGGLMSYSADFFLQFGGVRRTWSIVSSRETTRETCRSNRRQRLC
jgi:hypothetical protein